MIEQRLIFTSLCSLAGFLDAVDAAPLSLKRKYANILPTLTNYTGSIQGRISPAATTSTDTPLTEALISFWPGIRMNTEEETNQNRYEWGPHMHGYLNTALAVASQTVEK